MNQFYPHGQGQVSGGGSYGNKGYGQQQDFQKGLFNMMFAGNGQQQQHGKGLPQRPPPVRFFENQIYDLRKVRFGQDGEEIKVSSDPDAEVVAFATEKGAGECLKLQRSTLLHVRCGDDPRKAHCRARLVSRCLNLDMPDEKFPAFMVGLARLQEVLGIENKSVSQWIAENHPEEGIRRNLFPGTAGDGDDELVHQLLQQGSSFTCTFSHGATTIGGTNVSRPDLSMPPPPGPVDTPARGQDSSMTASGSVGNLTGRGDAVRHDIATPAVAPSSLEPGSGNPAPRTRQRTASNGSGD